jgi:hypothetical protein
LAGSVGEAIKHLPTRASQRTREGCRAEAAQDFMLRRRTFRNSSFNLDERSREFFDFPTGAIRAFHPAHARHRKTHRLRPAERHGSVEIVRGHHERRREPPRMAQPWPVRPHAFEPGSLGKIAKPPYTPGTGKIFPLNAPCFSANKLGLCLMFPGFRQIQATVPLLDLAAIRISVWARCAASRRRLRRSAGRADRLDPAVLRGSAASVRRAAIRDAVLRCWR